MTMEAKRTVFLREELCRKVQERFGAQFEDINQLITHVLEQLIADDAMRLDEAEQRVVEQRLRDLGYV